MSRRLLPLLLILFVAGVVAAAEIPVSDFSLETSRATKRLPVIAAGDGGYLAAWLDERNGSRTLMATRIGPTGVPLDPLGIPLGRASFYRPQILWNGDVYLVLWNDFDGKLLIAGVSRDGHAEAPRVLLERGALGQRPRAVATNGSYIVVGYTSSGAMHVAVLTLEGVLVNDRIVDSRNSWTPTVLANDDEFLVAWNVAGDVIGLRLDSRGVPKDTLRKIGEGQEAEVLRNGSSYVVVAQQPNYVSWAVSRDLTSVGTAAPLVLNQLDRDPSLLDGSPAMMAVFESTDNAYVTAITFDANGREAGPRKRIVQSGPSHFAVARGDDALAIIEVKYDGIAHDALIGSLFDDDTLSRKAPDRVLTLSAYGEDSPVIAGGKGHYLVVWRRSGSLLAGRFLQNGTRMDGNGFVLDPASSSPPSVVFDGERFVVTYLVWRGNQRRAVVRFVSPTEGLLPNSYEFESREAPTLEAGNGVVLVTWIGNDGIWVGALRGTEAFGSPQRIAESYGSAPVAKWNGRQFLVAWIEFEFDYDMYFPSRMLSMRIDSDLTRVDAQPRVLMADAVDSESPALAAWKDGWLIAFEDDDQVRLHEIDVTGQMMETPLFARTGISPKLVNTVSQPWLAWTTWQNNVLSITPIKTDGTLDEGRSRSLAAPPVGSSFAYNTALASLGNDVAAAYARVAPEAGSVERVFFSVMQNPMPMRRRAVR